VQGGGLRQVRFRRHRALHRARRRHALPARGLPHCCSTRHAELHRAWRRQAVQGGGLHQVRLRQYGVLRGARRRQALPARRLPHCCSRRRHATLPGAWRRQAVPPGGLLQGSRSRQSVLQAMSPARAARRCVGRCIATAWRGPVIPSHGQAMRSDTLSLSRLSDRLRRAKSTIAQNRIACGALQSTIRSPAAPCGRLSGRLRRPTVDCQVACGGL
jgi:hypothetical protein